MIRYLKITTKHEVFGFCDAQTNQSKDGILYEANQGLVAGTLENDLSAKDKPLELSLINRPGLATRIKNLQFQGDQVMLTFFTDTHILRHGWLGNLYCEESRITLELLNITHKLSREIGKTYAQECRANLGDKDCQVDLNAVSFTTEITEVEPEMKVSLKGINDQLTYVSLHWLTGENKGKICELVDFKTKAGCLIFSLPLLGKIELGEKVTLIPGCDKSLRMCRDYFQNTLNFRGEPFIPGF